MSTTTYVQTRADLQTMSPGEINGKALALARELQDLGKRQRLHDSRWLEVMRELQSIVPAGLYEGYRGVPQDPNPYVVIAVVHSAHAPFECSVTLAALYGPKKGVPYSVPLLGHGEGFLDPVHSGSTATHRYKFIGTRKVEVHLGNATPDYHGPFRYGVD